MERKQLKMYSNKKITLGSRTIGEDSKPYLIAEIGVNHEGSIDTAKLLIDLAKEGGADAVKFQTYKAEYLASKNSPAYWDLSKENTNSQYELFKKYDVFNKSEYLELHRYAHQVGIDFLSTPFDIQSVDLLVDIVPFFKIASADITNLPFLRKIASKQKPVILSTGATNKEEITYAINVLKDNGADSIAILHCILNYPTTNENASLNMISDLKNDFPEFLIGYSDHTLPCQAMLSLTTSFLLGAVIIEKHFTHNKKLPGNDHYHAMDINDLKNFRKFSNEIITLKGNNTTKECLPSERISRKNARRSIVANSSLKKGEYINEDNIICKRPGSGISPLHWDELIGMQLKKDVDNDQLLSWEDF